MHPVNTQSLIERSRAAADLWQAVLPPDYPAPELQQFVRWCDRFQDNMVDRAVMRVARKLRHPENALQPADAPRYVTGLLLNMTTPQENTQCN